MKEHVEKTKRMPSKSKKVMFNCSFCDMQVQVTHWVKIDGIDNPELKRSILDGSLFIAKCGGCGSEFTLAPNIQYYELQHVNKQNFAAYLVSSENIEADRDYIEFMPIFRQMGARIHVVNSSGELRKLIQAYDSGILPPETIIKASHDPKKNADHEKQLSKTASQLENFVKEIESGNISDDTIKQIKRGRKLMNEKKRNVSAITEIFKDPKNSCVMLGAVGCLIALLKMPDDFYVVLRFVVVAAAAAAIWLIQKSTLKDYSKTIMILLLGLLAVIFNPIMPLDLNRGDWTLFNLLGSGLLFLSYFLSKGKIVKPEVVKINPTNQNLPPVITNRTSREATESNLKKNHPKEEKPIEFYTVLEFPPQGVTPTLSNILIMASASIEKNKDGNIKYTISVSKDAKPNHFLEAQAAIFWKKEIDNKGVSIQQAASWIDELCQSTARQYWGKLNSETEKTNELYLLAALAKATVHYALTNAESLGLPPSMVKWSKDRILYSSGGDTIAIEAQAFAAAEKLGLINKSFIKKLSCAFKTRS
jgi:hypothetical protein